MDSIPYGYCHCGCGNKTNPYHSSSARGGWKKGDPHPYLVGHYRRINARYRVEDRGFVTPCWVSTLRPLRHGYVVEHHKGEHILAHRLMYEKMKGLIPEGLQLDHLCRVRNCINPDHLEPVTRSVNIRRGYNPNREKTHCKRGHEFDAVNTYIQPSGRRQCRICKRAKALARYHRLRRGK